MMATERYHYWLNNWSDMQAHLPTLFEHARGNVLELGVRAGVSTSALLAGVEAHGGHVWSVDRDDCSPVFAGHPQWTFIQADSLDLGKIRAARLQGYENSAAVEYNDTLWDLVFIDTEHTETRTLAELRTWGPYVHPGGLILLHDTDDSSTYPGVRNAISFYCLQHGLAPDFHGGSYGLGVIRC